MGEIGYQIEMDAQYCRSYQARVIQLVTDSPSFGGCVAYRCAMPAVTALASGRLDAAKGYGDREVWGHRSLIDSSRWDGGSQNILEGWRCTVIAFFAFCPASWNGVHFWGRDCGVRGFFSLICDGFKLWRSPSGMCFRNAFEGASAVLGIPAAFSEIRRD